MRQEEADHYIGVMRSVLATLQWLAKHEDAIKERVARGSTEAESETQEGH